MVWEMGFGSAERVRCPSVKEVAVEGWPLRLSTERRGGPVASFSDDWFLG